MNNAFFYLFNDAYFNVEKSLDARPHPDNKVMNMHNH